MHMPHVKVKWLYSIDNPIVKSSKNLTDDIIAKYVPGKKWSLFSPSDSQRIESSYQDYRLNGQDTKTDDQLQEYVSDRVPLAKYYQNLKHVKIPKFRVPVNEDKLFEANVANRTFTSIYWNGPVYKIRRGIWFTNDNVPLSTHLTEQIEKGYRELKPWEFVRIQDDSALGRSNGLKKKVNDSWLVKVKDVEKKVLYIDEKHAYLINDVKSFNKVKLFLLQNIPKDLVPGVEYIQRGSEEKTENKPKAKETPDNSMINELKQIFGQNSATELLTNQMEQDNKDTNKSSRDVDHLVLCVHGIGQILGTKYENVNFIHTVNLLRKNLKSQAKLLMNENNCNIQVIPIIWRSLIKFNNHRNDFPNDSRFPSLANITINEIMPVRYLINNTLLDILLYYEEEYKDEILVTVVKQANEAFRKYKAYNPNFNGKVSLVGHSLGSAICFDILSLQKFLDDKYNKALQEKPIFKKHQFQKLQLDFNVNNYFAIGSPFGLFNLLKKKKIASRKLLMFQDPEKLQQELMKSSYPSCNRFYNIYDLCDPVAYRIEPLINRNMTNQPAEKFHYKKKVAGSSSFGDELLTTSKSYITNGTLIALLKQVENFMGSTKPQIQDTIPTFDTPSPAHFKYNDKYYHLKKEIEQNIDLLACNSNGRVDYSIPQEIYDLALINTLKSHTTYFENEHISKFLLNELLLNQAQPDDGIIDVKEKQIKSVDQNENHET